MGEMAEGLEQMQEGLRYGTNEQSLKTNQSRLNQRNQ